MASDKPDLSADSMSLNIKKKCFECRHCRAYSLRRKVSWCLSLKIEHF